MAETEQGALNPAQAAAAIGAFFAREGQPATPVQIAERIGAPSLTRHPDLGPLLDFRGALGTLWVSPRGNVVYYSGKALHRPEQPVAPEKCYDIAKAFAERHVADFAERNFVPEQPKVDATSCKIRWGEQPRPGKETAIFPNWAEVVIQIPAGRVTRFSASDLRLVRTTAPAISEAQARALIRSRFSRSAIEEIELMQLPKDDGKSSFTVWTALVMTLSDGTPMTERVTLDADTGAIVPE